jgi:hypothetical protein
MSMEIHAWTVYLSIDLMTVRQLVMLEYHSKNKMALQTLPIFLILDSVRSAMAGTQAIPTLKAGKSRRTD